MNDIAYQLQLLYNIPIDPIDTGIQIYLDTHPQAAAQTIVSTTGAPDAAWDSVDTANVGKNFGVGFFVQDNSTGVIYRCFDATPGAAVWTIVIRENI